MTEFQVSVSLVDFFHAFYLTSREACGVHSGHAIMFRTIAEGDSLMEIHIHDELIGTEKFSVQEMAELAPSHFPVGERVDGVTGRAFDWLSWYQNWREGRQGDLSRVPTHLKVEAADEFQATVPWSQLDKALFLYAQESGEPLKKGYPIRLYVPDGSSECLNVKSVVAIRLLYDGAAGDEATYGYKNVITPDELRKTRKTS